MKNNLDHLAIIMDGNTRWARLNKQTYFNGYQAGAENAQKIILAAHNMGVKYLTLYLFSSENWKRPAIEIAALLKLTHQYLQNADEFLNKYSLKLKVIGNMSKLPQKLVKKIDSLQILTTSNQAMTVSLALNYGGREEIINACRLITKQNITEINETTFRNFLYDPAMPDVDLLIRTSKTQRISNFLLWQISYAEIFFSDKLWPDFTIEDLTDIINKYLKTPRNFGGR